MAPLLRVQGDDPRLDPYRTLKGRDLRPEGIFIAEGDRIIRRLASSGLTVRSFLLSRKHAVRFRTLLAPWQRKGLPFYVMEDAPLAALIGFKFHQGLLAVVERPADRSLKEILTSAPDAGLFLILNGVKDPENVGTILRTARAFGVDAVVMDRRSADPFSRRVVRVSIGTVFSQAIAVEKDLPAALRWLKRVKGVRLVAASPDAKARSLHKADLKGKIGLILGAETAGIAPQVERAANFSVRIPHAKAVDSLNVATAAAILLYAASRSAAP